MNSRYDSFDTARAQRHAALQTLKRTKVMRLQLPSAILCSLLAIPLAIACNGNSREISAADDVPPGVENTRRALRSSWPNLLQERENQRIVQRPIERYFNLQNPTFGLVHESALKTFYQQNGWEPVFTTNGTPNFRAKAALEVMQTADEHGLLTTKYLRPRIAELIQRQQELRHALQELPNLNLSQQDWDQVDALLNNHDIQALDRPIHAVLDALLSKNNAPTPDLAQAWNDRLTIRRAIAGGDAELELILADAWLDWTWDMSDAWVTKYDFNAPKDQELANRLREEQLVASMGAIAVTTTAEAAENFAQTKIPRHPQYQRLLQSLQKYRDIVDTGGWETIPAVSLARGSSGRQVAALKTRLQREGFYQGPIDERFDDALQEAVRKYQSTHQLEVTGRSSAAFWSSLNTSAEDRLAQVQLSIQRWRESAITHNGTYVFINVPDFHAELWKDGELLRRWKIVVGNTQRMCRSGRRAYVNATPMQSANMSFVVLNPTWTVPPRITTEEILPALLENPNYLEENGYERIVADNGFTMLRQVPGPNNALGAVKFMFPNEHDTYMHDTPRKQFFEPIYRAYSHGCMRVEDPMGLLEQILTLDGQWDAANIRRIRETNREHRINLNTPIPVHTEYFVVRVDDDGYTHFLSDLYRLDRERLDPRFVREESCEPPARTAVSTLRINADGELLVRDEVTGELVNAREALDVPGADGQAPDALPINAPANAPANTGAALVPPPIPALPTDFGP